MRRAALAVATAALLAVPSAASAARTVGFTDWQAISADLQERRLVWNEAATVRLDPREGGRDLPAGLRPFVYYRVHVSHARLDRTRRGFAGQADQLLAFRTQIARMAPGLVGGDAGGIAVIPGATRFAAPVVWCCADGVETVMYSDGRAAADRPLAATVEGGRVRALLRGVDGAAWLVAGDPAERIPALSRVAFPGTPSAGRAALAPGLVAWVDDGAPRRLRFGVPGDTGVAGGRTVPLPGDALRVWADRGLVAVAVRRGGGVALLRVDARGPRVRTVWRGSRVPHVGLGEGTVAVGEGRRVLAGRGAPLRLLTRARGRVAAVAPSGRRVAFFERIRRKGERRTVARIGRIR